MFNKIDDALNWLYIQKKQKKREDLSRIDRCIDLLDLKPNYPVIHLAGTNGKGSTATFVKNILNQSGYKVGFFVSPFVVCFNERIQINDEYISDEKILTYLNELNIFAENYQDKYNDTIPFFELTFLMALMHFKNENINVGVIECGLGGRLDATNVLKTNISIITNIGYDHMATLGNTLEEIAYHKLGITRQNQVCITAAGLEIKDYFINYAKENNIIMKFVNDDVKNINVSDKTVFTYKNNHYETLLLGEFQAYNAAIAIEAALTFDNEISIQNIQKGLLKAFWPGRLELISKMPKIILDGAHNIHGVTALVNTIKNQYPNYFIKTIFTALADKAYPEMLNKLDEVTDYYYFTTINDTRATDFNEFLAFTNKKSSFGDYDQIFLEAISNLKDNELLLITGSLHFISNARKTVINFLKEKKNA